MSSAEIQREEIRRRVLQQGNDVAALYDLLEGVDDKIDTLMPKSVRASRGWTPRSIRWDARLSGKLDAILQRLGG